MIFFCEGGANLKKFVHINPMYLLRADLEENFRGGGRDFLKNFEISKKNKACSLFKSSDPIKKKKKFKNELLSGIFLDWGWGGMFQVPPP